MQFKCFFSPHTMQLINLPIIISRINRFPLSEMWSVSFAQVIIQIHLMDQRRFSTNGLKNIANRVYVCVALLLNNHTANWVLSATAIATISCSAFDYTPSYSSIVLPFRTDIVLIILNAVMLIFCALVDFFIVVTFEIEIQVFVYNAELCITHFGRRRGYWRCTMYDS